jgi:hypothetical protein
LEKATNWNQSACVNRAVAEITLPGIILSVFQSEGEREKMEGGEV